MTRYSPIIGLLLGWQLLMPLLCGSAGLLYPVALITSIILILLLASKRWERNSYSVYSAIVAAILGISLVAVGCAKTSPALTSVIQVLWIYGLIAFTATSPYPLAIRMPVIIYTLVYFYMLPPGIEAIYFLPIAAIFAAVICGIAWKWRNTTGTLTISYGPQEPPFSLSLSVAIVMAVFISLCRNIADCYATSRVAGITSLTLLSAICIWLLLARDWQKNLLAVTALVLMIAVHCLSTAELFIHNEWLRIGVFVLSISPVMFHTTAPVFRGMRIVITLYAVYSALNRQQLIAALAASPLQIWQQHAIIIGIDAALTLTLLAMAHHWRENK